MTSSDVPTLWEVGATNEAVAEAILADLNYKRLPYERAVIVTTRHVERIREAVREQLAREIEAERDRLRVPPSVDALWLRALDNAASIARGAL